MQTDGLYIYTLQKRDNRVAATMQEISGPVRIREITNCNRVTVDITGHGETSLLPTGLETCHALL